MILLEVGLSSYKRNRDFITVHVEKCVAYFPPIYLKGVVMMLFLIVVALLRNFPTSENSIKNAMVVLMNDRKIM